MTGEIHKKIILLVEDNPDDVFLMQRAFQKSNLECELVVARDGMEALQYLSGEGKNANRNISQMPEIVILDLKMPKMDGIRVLQWIRSNEKTKYLPVVIFSGSQEEQDLIDSYRFGTNSFIRKPVDFDQFHHTINDLGLYWLVKNVGPYHQGNVLEKEPQSTDYRGL